MLKNKTITKKLFQLSVIAPLQLQLQLAIKENALYHKENKNLRQNQFNSEYFYLKTINLS
jgi:hypothetical protein